ncbi:L domain-like protein [Pleomassaria siparia CBS 279.74]|uniref:L domain-like protein n=1 Tax=Pleomassaria siparia CBS 279.74 TaxID=1314801 RepID=A0A6G1KIJ2_9PLEO|nr:L domain-like protein [Pleomassaria siparia CBS 279.74]
MDAPRPSGIPRPSRLPTRLPVLKHSASQSQLLRPASSTEQLRKKPSISSLSRPPPTLQKKPSRISLVRADSTSTAPSTPTGSNRPSLTSATQRAAPARNAQRRASNIEASTFKKPIGRPPSSQTRVVPPTNQSAIQDDDDVLGDLNAFRSASRASSRVGFRDNEPGHVEETEPEPAKSVSRKSRPSLSDRTIESLSQLPPSPARGKGRRSSFLAAAENGSDGSMPPPLRPASAMGNNGRPMTSDGTPRPTTPRSFGSLAQRAPMTTPGKRSMSASIPAKATSTPSKPPSVTRPVAQVKKQPLSQVLNVQSTPRVRPLSNSKTMTARTLKSRPSLAGIFEQAISPPPTATAIPLTPSPTSITPSRTAPIAKKTAKPTLKPTNSSSALREHIAKAKASRRSDVAPISVETPSKPSTSSSALREQIAKAKEAARRATPARQFGNGTPPKEVPAVKEGDFAIIPDPVELASFDFGLDDPFNQSSKGSKSLLQRRVNSARGDGRLNIAAMGLTEIPDDVLNMYKYNPDADVAWGEVVDLNVIIAADNDIQRISDQVFPDIDPESAIDSDDPGPQFGSVHSLDFHGNVLRELPTGLRRLTQLSKLNLSRNKLTIDALEVISQVTTLRELKLADNTLSGNLPTCLSGLVNLEVLELQSNKLASLPAEIRQLAHLRVLDISDNQFTALPSELFSVPIVELLASKNAFSGAFFNVDAVSHLQKLVLSNNSISSLCNLGNISLPALKHLDLEANRLSDLPNMSSWTSLTTLLIGGNKLSSLPDGFVSLQQNLHHADFTGNDITAVDEKIALMDGLKILTLAANPLRVRKFLTMNTSDLKSDLQSRMEPSEMDDSPKRESEAGTESTANEDWQLRPSGILDFSGKSLTEIDDDALLSFAQSNDVRQLYLQQNLFTTIPTVTSQLDFLAVLDLSKNNIDRVAKEALHLPKLRELRLVKNKMQSFDDIVSLLSAPGLQHLDVSINRISGPLPNLREFFPELLILQASDNQVTDVSAESLTGLKIVNLNNNEIPRLEPRIGLLAGTLTQLGVEGNRFRVPNYAILSKGTEAVFQWLRGRIPSATEDFSAESHSSEY